jgi:hypothetical protein
MTDSGGDEVCLWGGENATGCMLTWSNDHGVLPGGAIGMTCTATSAVANHTKKWSNYSSNEPNDLQCMDSYGGQHAYAAAEDLMYENMEVLGIPSPQHYSPRCTTPTPQHMGPCSIDYSTTVANEHVFYPPVCAMETLFEQMAKEPKHLKVKRSKKTKTKEKSAAALVRQSNSDKKAEKKEAQLLLGLATVGICKTPKEVSTPGAKNTNRAAKNAESAKKYRSDKDDRMAFLVQANARLEFDNTMLMMEIDAYNINGPIPK